MEDGAEYVAKAIRLEYCPQWGEDAYSWTLRSDFKEHIVRCKDCVSSYMLKVYEDEVGLFDRMYCIHPGGQTDYSDDIIVQPDGFCKWGERRED